MFKRCYEKRILVAFREADAKRIEELAAHEEVSRACIVRRLVTSGLRQAKPASS